MSHNAEILILLALLMSIIAMLNGVAVWHARVAERGLEEARAFHEAAAILIADARTPEAVLDFLAALNRFINTGELATAIVWMQLFPSGSRSTPLSSTLPEDLKPTYVRALQMALLASASASWLMGGHLHAIASTIAGTIAQQRSRSPKIESAAVSYVNHHTGAAAAI